MLTATRAKVPGRALIVAAACVVLFATGAAAQAPPTFDVRFQSAKVTLQEYDDLVRGWERDASLTMTLVVLLAALGGVTIVLQGVSKKWTKVATVVVGAMVSTLTLVNTSFFDADYKTFSRRAAEGRRLIRSANEWLENRNQVTSDADREAILQEIQKRVVLLAALGSQGASAPAKSESTSLVPLFETVAYAQAAQGAPCGCLAKAPSDYRFQYFCGSATNRGLTDARRQATNAAQAEAVKSLQRVQGSARADSLTNYVQSVATEVDSCVEKAAAGFKMSVMVRVPAALAAAQAQQAFAYSGLTRVRLKLDKIHVIQDGSAGATGWSFDVLVDGKPAFSLPKANYDDRAGHGDVTAAPSLASDIWIQRGQVARIEVRGKRSFDLVGSPDTAIGSQIVDVVGGSVAIAVKNGADEKDGSFVFYFTASAGGS